MPSQLIFKVELDAAATPPAGYVTFYAVGDILYWKDDAGVQHSIASGTGDLAADGTVPLTANWNVGEFKILADQFESTIVSGDVLLETGDELLLENGDELRLEQGAPPLIVASTGLVANLNADLLDGMEASEFATAAQGTTADGAVAKSTFDANTVLKADSDNTPVALPVGEQTLLGRITAGSIAALSPAQVRTLISVEENADVTDAANVQAAGALMDSEVTNLADVKAFDPADYATAAQGATADSALQDITGENLTDLADVDIDKSKTPADGDVLTFDGTDWNAETPAGGGSGDVATDAIWDAAGDLAVGSGANTAARLPIGAALQALRVNAGGTALEYGDPGLNQSEVDARVVAVASGTKEIYISQRMMYLPSTNAAGPLVTDTDPQSAGRGITYFPFDANANERVLFDFFIPGGMDPTQSVAFRVFWVASTTDTGVVRWELRAHSASDGGSFSGFHTGVSAFADDAGQGTIDLMHRTAWVDYDSSIITNALAGHYVQFALYRKADDAADTYTGDAWLIGVALRYFTIAPTDD